MLLGNLFNSYTIQGNIRLSHCVGEREVNVRTIEGTEDLSTAGELGLWAWLPVRYIFAAPDGYLHIECEATDD